MFKIKNLLIISLFITTQAFASEDLSALEQVWNIVSDLPGQLSQACKDAMKMLVVAPDSIRSGKNGLQVSGKDGFSMPVLPVIPTPDIPVVPNWRDEFKSQLHHFNEDYVQPGWEATQIGLASVQKGVDKGIEFGLQKGQELTQAVKNNPYRTIVIIGGLLVSGKIIKDALNAKKNDDKKRTKIKIFEIDTEHNPVKLAAQALALATGSWYAYKMKNNIFGLFTKKAIAA